MEKVLHKGRLLEIYTGIDEMPITVFQNFNRFLLIDAGVGGDIESIDRHLARLAQYNAKGDQKNFQTEIRNLRQNLAFAISRTSPNTLAFGALVASVNGKKVEDTTDEGIKALIDNLGRAGLPYGVVLKLIDQVKKKYRKKPLYIFQKKRQTAGKGNF